MKSLTTLFLVFFFSLCNAQDNDFKLLFENKVYQSAQIQLLITEVETDKEIYSYNDDKLFTPASVSKVITTFLASDYFEEDKRLETKVGVKNNMIVIKSGGDPTINSKYFKNYHSNDLEQIAVYIKSLNVFTKNTPIILDASIINKLQFSQNRILADISNYYAAQPSAFCYHDNLYTLNLKSEEIGGKVTLSKVVPSWVDYQFKINLSTSSINKDLAYIIGDSENNSKIIEGSIPANRSLFKIKGSYQNGNEYFKKALASLLNINETNISISYQSIQDVSYNKIFYSPEIKDIIKVTNYKSVNLFADQLMVLLQQSKEFEKGLNFTSYFIKQSLDSILNNSDIWMYDGCGLSPLNKFSPKTTMLFLNHYSNFYNLLPQAGVSGTLKYLLKDNHKASNFYLKSGTIKFVKNYIGYYNHKGNLYSIIFTINNNTSTYSNQVKLINSTLENIIKLIEKQDEDN